MVELEQTGRCEQTSEGQSAGETNNHFRTGNRNNETDLRSKFQEPGCTTGVKQQIGDDWKVDQAFKGGGRCG